MGRQFGAAVALMAAIVLALAGCSGSDGSAGSDSAPLEVTSSTAGAGESVVDVPTTVAMTSPSTVGRPSSGGTSPAPGSTTTTSTPETGFPEGWPPYLDIPDDADLEGASVRDGIYLASASSSATSDDVFDYYRSSLDGWKECCAGEVSVGGDDTRSLGFKRDGRRVSVSVTDGKATLIYLKDEPIEAPAKP